MSTLLRGRVSMSTLLRGLNMVTFHDQNASSLTTHICLTTSNICRISTWVLFRYRIHVYIISTQNSNWCIDASWPLSIHYYIHSVSFKKNSSVWFNYKATVQLQQFRAKISRLIERHWLMVLRNYHQIKRYCYATDLLIPTHRLWEYTIFPVLMLGIMHN